MATYCIGDVQGCFVELQSLLNEINYNDRIDNLWFVGDLVNRGPKSLEVLRFVKDLPNTKVVLGNHDLYLLCIYHGIIEFVSEELKQVLFAPDCHELLEWLRMRPLLYYDVERNFVLVHAGIYPAWKLQEAIRYAHEVEMILQGGNFVELLKHLYGNEPKNWSDTLQGWDRLRFIVNAFTRMRFCDLQGNLEFANCGAECIASPGFFPWFKVPWRKAKDVRVLFGHWASLRGNTNEQNVFALDTGCVWGESLTAMCLDDGTITSVSAKTRS